MAAILIISCSMIKTNINSWSQKQIDRVRYNSEDAFCSSQKPTQKITESNNLHEFLQYNTLKMN